MHGIHSIDDRQLFSCCCVRNSLKIQTYIVQGLRKRIINFLLGLDIKLNVGK